MLFKGFNHIWAVRPYYLRNVSPYYRSTLPLDTLGWSGGAKVLGKLPVPGRLTNLDLVGQGPVVLAVGAGGGCLDIISLHYRGWSGGAMVLGKLPVPGRPTIWITVGQGPTALVVGAGGGGLDIFTLIYPFLSSFSLSLGDGPI